MAGRKLTEPRPTDCGHFPYKARGLCSKCYHAQHRQRPEVKQATREYLAANSDRIRESQAAYQAANRDKDRQRRAAWREANRESVRTKARERAQQNAERYAPQRREWLAANEEQQREYYRRYYLDNKERYQAQQKAWREANPEAAQVHRQRRRSRLSEGTFTLDEWRDLLDEFGRRCAYCNTAAESLVMEHMTPLARGGQHAKHNVVPACAPCNGRKFTKTALEFAGLTGEGSL